MNVAFKTVLRWWMIPLVTAIALRVVVLASGLPRLSSDEAIVGLMARHINQGRPIPIMYYGSPYPGSLDALWIALSFRIFGENVLAIRLAESILYFALVGITMAVALRLSGDRRAALIAGLLTAIPTVLITVYTTATVGSYAELVLIGAAVWLLGVDLIGEHARSLWRWLVFGLLVGLGWWTSNLIVGYVIPLGVVMLIRIRKLGWLGPLVGVIGALAGAAPWFVYQFQHNWTSLGFLQGGFVPGESSAGPPLLDKITSLLFLGVPGLLGLRYPPSVLPWMGVAAIPVIAAYAALLIPVVVRSLRQPMPDRLPWLMIGLFTMIFLASFFGLDGTGRYLLPITLPLTLTLSFEIARLADRSRWLYAVAGVIMAINLTGTLLGLTGDPPGMSHLIDPDSDYTEEYDQQAIDFLKAHGGEYGYSTYWGAFRLVFVSGETVILSPNLPHRRDLVMIGDDRYPPYTAMVNAAPKPVFITANLPPLDDAVRQRLDALNVTYSVEVIGPYVIYYDLSRKVTAAEIGFR